jgi:hypothetical protein
LSKRIGIASLAAIVGAIAVWNASPAGADPVVAQAAPAASPAPSPSPTPTPPPHLLQVSGYADAGYTSASIASAVGTPGGSQINGRVFDTLNQQIQFHNFNLQAAYNGPIGGKIEASFGDDANVINSYPKSVFAPGTEIDITQAYLSGTSGQFTGIVGKFETLAGAELIESPSDIEFSRSILFGYAVPFTHTGGRVTWAMNSNLSFIAGLNRGWDTTWSESNSPFAYVDTSSLTFEGGAAWNPSKAFSATLQGYDGQVEEGFAVATPTFPVNYTPLAPGRPVRSLIDTVLTYHMTPALTLILNGDAGQQTNSIVVNGNGTPFGYGTGTWSGLAGYASYALSGQWTVSLRGEYFGDNGGLRTGISQKWTEATATAAYAPNSNIIVRGEIRGDKSNQAFFSTGFGLPAYKTNAQFGIETIVKWP